MKELIPSFEKAFLRIAVMKNVQTLRKTPKMESLFN